MTLYRVQFQNAGRTWSDMGWRFVFTTFDLANSAMAKRQAERPQTNYRIASIDIN
jgi:hypothetical protein